MISTSVYTSLNLFNFVRKHVLQICLRLSAQRLSESTIVKKKICTIWANLKAYINFATVCQIMLRYNVYLAG